MPTQRFEIKHYEKLPSGDWSTTPTSLAILHESIDLSEEEGIKTKTDGFQFRISNAKYQLLKSTGVGSETEPLFQVDDRVEIYFWEGDGSPTANDIVMDGYITEIKNLIEETGKFVSIDGVNRTERMLNIMVPCIAEDTDKRSTGRASDVIVWMVSLLQNYDFKNRKPINASLAYLDVNGNRVGGGYIYPTTKQIEFYQGYKTLYEQIETLSDDEYTNNGTYIFWLDLDNNLHWQPKSTVSNLNIVEGGGGPSSSAGQPYKINMNNGIYDTINAMIINAGKDAKGYTVLALSYDLVSAAAKGFRWKYVAEPRLGKEFYQKNLLGGPNRDQNVDLNDDGYPDSYPYTMVGHKLGPIVVNNDTDYNTRLREVIRYQSEIWGSEKCKLLGEPRWKGKIILRGTVAYTKGELVAVHSYSIFGSDQDGYMRYIILRNVDIAHTFNVNGWETELTLKQDERSVDLQLGVGV